MGDKKQPILVLLCLASLFSFASVASDTGRWASDTGHPIIFVSSSNFLTPIHRASSALEKNDFLNRRVSHFDRTLHLIVTNIRHTIFQLPIIPYPGCSRSVREAPNIVPYEVQTASTLLIGVLSRPQNGSCYGPARQ